MSLTIYTGTMKSGKSLKLLELYDRFQYQDKKISVFKPMFDTSNLHSRFFTKEVEIINIKNISDIDYTPDVIIIDEIQFFEDTLDNLSALQELSKNCRVICAGLDTNHKGLPFEFVGKVMCISDEVFKLCGICEFKGCFNNARYNKLQSKDVRDFVLDTGDNYKIKCRRHF